MCVQGVSHDKWRQYQEHRMDALTSKVAQESWRYCPYAGSTEVVAAVATLVPIRDEIFRQEHEMVREFNCPTGELVIVGPSWQLGPLPDDTTFMGMRVVAEHSATGFRVVWERPV